MKKILTLLFVFAAVFTSKATFAAIYGASSVCIGSSALVYDSSSSGPSTGGTWSSSNMAVATVSSSGMVMGLSAGTTMLTYTGTSGISTGVFTVYPVPAAIVGGAAPFCAGTTTTLTCTSTGGTWFSANMSVATVGVATGVVTGVTGGTAAIQYRYSSGCYSQKIVTVNAVPVPDSITGASSVCTGSSITLTCITPGGAWSSSSSAIATVSATGVVAGISNGVATISYTVTGPCGTGTRTKVITVTSTTSPGTITGTTTVGTGFTTSLYNSVSGGTWSSSTPSVATISAGGVVSGIAVGTTVITYAVSGCSGLAYATTTVTVTVPNCISGNVLFTGSPYYGPVRVWLIKYNPSTLMLTACDSTYVYASGTSVAYQFCGMGTDSFRVKAACDSISSATGYIPTYHTSSSFWHSASVVYHVSGTHDINKNITMGIGTPTTGPGFIGGNVTTGANKGTADGDPVVGMLVYCINNTTGAVLQHATTDAAGHFTFTNLPVGQSYKIYPEAINYATTPYPPITLTSATTSMSAAHFIQHTLSMTITPIVVSVDEVNSKTTGVSVYPNPASGSLHIKWHAANTGQGTVTLTDVTGRQVVNNTIEMSNGNTSVDLSGLKAGLYIISVKAAGISYNAKITIQ